MTFTPHLSRRSFRLSLKLGLAYLKANFKLFFLALIVSLSVTGIAPEVFPKLFTKTTNRIGFEGNYTISTLPSYMQAILSLGLTKTDLDQKPIPAAALSWEVKDNGKIYTFNLDNKLFWQDGEQFTAGSINYNLKGVEIDKSKPREVTFKLKEPFAPLPALLSQPLFKNGLMGFNKIELRGIKLTRGFVESLDIVNISDGAKTTYKFYPNERSVITALKLGSIDEAQRLRETYGLENDPKYTITSATDSGNIVTVFFNLNRKNLEDKATRQALAYALPDTFGNNEPANSPISKYSWVYNPNFKNYPQNIALATRALTPASESAKLKISLLTNPRLEKTAKLIAEAWEKVGVSVKIVLSDVVSRSFDAYLTEMVIPLDPDQYSIWHSTQITNISNYKSPRVDKLLEDGRRTINPEERKQIYQNFQRAITEDVPAVFLYHPTLYTIKRN